MESFWEKEILLADCIADNTISLDRGRVISSVDLYQKPGSFPVYSSSSQNNGLFGTFNEFDFDEELITWSVDGGGYFFYRPQHKFSVTNVSGILRINKPKFDYKFLYYSLYYQHSNQIFDYVDKAHPSVIKKRYLLPDISLPEQQKIASILTKMDDAIANTEALIAKYENIKKGLMQDLLTKGIDENGNIRSEETHRFKDSPLGKIPVEWEVKPIRKIRDLLTSGSRGWAQFYDVEGSKFIRITNLFRDQIEIDTSDLQFVKLPAQIEGSRSRLQKGDVLISITADLGIIGYVPDSFGEAYVNQHIALLRICDDNISSKFIAYFLSSDFGQNMFKFFNDGGAKAGLNLPTIDKLLIILPDIKEQQKIIEVIEKSKISIKRYEQLRKKLIEKKKGLMQDLLSGKVRVN